MIGSDADPMMDILAANREEKLLLAHVEDLWARAESGVLSHTAYLSPGEQMICRSFLQSRGGNENDSFLFYGGFAYAERRLLFCLPDYLSPCFNGQESDTKMSDWLLSQCEDSSGIAAVLIRGSGFCSLTHRDYLGALLSLGIERDRIGDICCQNESSAVIFTLASIASFLSVSLERVGADKVSVSVPEREQWRAMPDQHRYQEIVGSVASDRLDCLVGEFAALSREKAKQAIAGGLVNVNYRPETRPDVSIQAGSVISIRGVGRFRFEGITGVSRRGKQQIRATKWI
ncbi:MAG: hypothetical protein J5938_02905 [Clostridia bacterium]|nr:hypothetical protein [Clostridia bacterium]